MPFIQTEKNYIPSKNGSRRYKMPPAYLYVMKRTKQTLRFITNKYVIAISVFALQILFFDDNNVFVQLDHKRQLNELLANKKYYEEKIKNTIEELANLQTSPYSIEKFVRENFKMKRANEDVFVVDEVKNDSPDKKK